MNLLYQVEFRAMTRLAEGYDTRDFPYAEILSDITQETIDEGLPPIEAYLRFLKKRDGAELSPNFDYASTAISSAGHSRQALTKNLSIGQIIAANTDTARQVVGLMNQQKTLVGKRVVLPVDLGNTRWSQSSFMLYWGLTIAGLDVRELESTTGALDNFEHHLGELLAR
jgi:hypothetical protein